MLLGDNGIEPPQAGVQPPLSSMNAAVMFLTPVCDMSRFMSGAWFISTSGATANPVPPGDAVLVDGTAVVPVDGAADGMLGAAEVVVGAAEVGAAVVGAADVGAADVGVADVGAALVGVADVGGTDVAVAPAIEHGAATPLRVAVQLCGAGIDDE